MFLAWVVIISLCLISALTGAYVFVVACVRTTELPWLDKEKIQKTPFGMFYDGIVYADAWLKNHGVSDVYVKSFDGLKLHGLWIPADNAKGSVLFAHGYRSTYLADFGMALDFYHDAGFNILLPDQRCHGKSEGKIITFGIKESRDMKTWIQFHNETFGAVPLLLSGMSMGASTMLYLADERLPANVKGFLVDCGFTTPKEILAKVFTSVTHLPAWLCLWSTGLCARIFGGFGLSEKDSRVSLTKNVMPIIMVHGLGDSFVPCEMTKEAYALCTGPKQILLVDNAEHGLSFIVDNERYMQIVRDFIKQYFS